MENDVSTRFVLSSSEKSWSASFSIRFPHFVFLVGGMQVCFLSEKRKMRKPKRKPSFVSYYFLPYLSLITGQSRGWVFNGCAWLNRYTHRVYPEWSVDTKDWQPIYTEALYLNQNNKGRGVIQFRFFIKRQDRIHYKCYMSWQQPAVIKTHTQNRTTKQKRKKYEMIINLRCCWLEASLGQEQVRYPLDDFRPRPQEEEGRKAGKRWIGRKRLLSRVEVGASRVAAIFSSNTP